MTFIIYWSNSKEEAMLPKAVLKRSTIAVLVAFWAFTWHCYALGVLPKASVRPPVPGKAVFQKEYASLDGLRESPQFKRRPFIVKAEVALPNPFKTADTLPIYGLISPLGRGSAERPVLFHLSLRAPPAAR